MFDIGWSELVLIGVVALVVLGPKELPGVLRMVGQWMGKARKMAAEFQGQFQEAMREAEMADVKKSFDDIKDAARDFSGANLLTSAHKDVEEALKLDTSRETPPAAAPVAPLAEAPSAALGVEPAPPAHASDVEPVAATSATPAPEPVHTPAPEAKAS